MAADAGGGEGEKGGEDKPPDGQSDKSGCRTKHVNP